jgi:hypothetical protein
MDEFQRAPPCAGLGWELGQPKSAAKEGHVDEDGDVEAESEEERTRSLGVMEKSRLRDLCSPRVETRGWTSSSAPKPCVRRAPSFPLAGMDEFQRAPPGAGLGWEQVIPAPGFNPGAARSGNARLRPPSPSSSTCLWWSFTWGFGCQIPVCPEVNPRWGGGRGRQAGSPSPLASPSCSGHHSHKP